MVITYQGGDSFKISQGDLALLINPKSGSRSKADVTLYSTTHALDEKDAFVISGPGEYEIKDIFIKGFLSEGPSGKINTIYLVSFEGMNLGFLGALSNPALSTQTLESIEDVDILFAPTDTLEVQASYKLGVSLEPAVIIPMYDSKASLDAFIKEGGEKVEAIDKFVVKKKDLEGKEGDIVVLKEE